MKKRMTALLLALAMLLPLMGAALAEQEIWQRGDRGEKVAEIQNRLKALGYLKQAEEGFFDEATEKALTAFQQRSGLLATGMADRKTMEMLFSEEFHGFRIRQRLPYRVSRRTFHNHDAYVEIL